MDLVEHRAGVQRRADNGVTGQLLQLDDGTTV
jgi:hypothetical protein